MHPIKWTIANLIGTDRPARKKSSCVTTSRLVQYCAYARCLLILHSCLDSVTSSHLFCLTCVLILRKFRPSNFKLTIVRGRYKNIPRNQRFSDFCDENLLDDEFHILLECTNEQIKDLRSKHLPKYYQHHNNMYKFIQLFEQSSTNKRLLVQLCRFLKEIFKLTNG